MNRASIFISALLISVPVFALDFTTTGSGAECVYASWLPVDGAASYQVIIDDETEVDQPLVRKYPDEIRVDVPGLTATEHHLTVMALGVNGAVIDQGTTPTLTPYSHVREGFAFTDGYEPGAYKSNGTLKDNARILYVTSTSVNNVTLEVTKDKKGATEERTGLAAILELMSKGFEKRPLAVRFIGTVTDSQFEGLKDGNYINLQGNNTTDRLFENVTIEGIGNDATLYGYGICFKRTRNIEIRNLAIMLFGDDAISMDTDNSHIWLHNIDFFYGRPGKDADQVKGDGSIDMKYRSTDISISFNHFWDSGKVMGCGGTTGESENLRITYHHNWFDHADSRCPRLHYTTAHIYNNYYDGVPVYCIGNTTESSAMVENNYFRAVKRPMMISGQGTDAYDSATGTYTLKGTFSGQDGGMTKAFNNVFAECTPKLVYQTQHAIHFDAWLVQARDEQLPETAVSVKGNWKYSNFDTAEDFYISEPDAVENVPDIVTSRAGRLQGGDLQWHFNNDVDDEDHSVNLPLKAAITDYQTSLLAVQGEENFETSGVAPVLPYTDTEATSIFDLAGRRVSANRSSLPAGCYIMYQNGKSSKVIVK